MYFVSVSMCMCMYVHFMSTGKWGPEIKVRFYFSGALHTNSRHCLSLGLELTKLGRLDGLPKAQRTFLSVSSALGFQSSTTRLDFLCGL